jgi:hypothetical protein
LLLSPGDDTVILHPDDVEILHADDRIVGFRWTRRCECKGAAELYRSRGDRDWWRCQWCDRRVRKITEADAPILSALARQKEV